MNRLLAISLFLCACGEVTALDPDPIDGSVDNQSPQIVSLAVDSGAPGDSLPGSCLGDDPDGDELVFAVTASSGSIVGDGEDFVWLPEAEDRAIITCRVEDGNGGVASEAVTATAIVTAGRIAHYEFSGDVTDSSGNGHDGARSRGVFVPGRDGVADTALAFDGDTTVELPNESAFDLTTFTLSAWVRVEPSGSQRTILAKPQGFGGGNFFWRINSDRIDGSPGQMVITYNDIAGAGVGLLTDDAVPPGRFAHVAVTLDPTALKLFIDGEVHGLLDVDVFAPNLSNDPVTIGKGIGASFFLGAMDDVRIYDRALTDDEIAAIARGHI